MFNDYFMQISFKIVQWFMKFLSNKQTRIHKQKHCHFCFRLQVKKNTKKKT